MNWPWKRRTPQASDEACHAAWESRRGLQDAHAMREQAADTHRRAEDLAARLEATRARNHFGEAVTAAMRSRSA